CTAGHPNISESFPVWTTYGIAEARFSAVSAFSRDSSTARLLAMAMFLSELAANLGGQRNPLYTLHDQLKAEGTPIVDLVRGNVNEHGIVYPPELLQDVLARAAESARIYRPDSIGQFPARE